MRRWLRRAAIALVAVELFWVVVANVVLSSGIIQKAASLHPENVEMGWDRAWSPWPGRAYVRGFTLKLQDGTQRFRLTVGRASVDVYVWELLNRKFHGTHIHAEEVRWRQLFKLKSRDGEEGRIAAFPPLEGFDDNPLKPESPPPPATLDDLDAEWKVRLDDVIADAEELWFVEYRYQGAAHVTGGFELIPDRKVWVGPATVKFLGGKLSAGDHTIASEFKADLAMTMRPLDIPKYKGLGLFHTLSADVVFDAPVEDIGVADIYEKGLKVQGAGRLKANVHVEDGKVLPTTKLEVLLGKSVLDYHRYHFTGNTDAKLVIEQKNDRLLARASQAGALTFPIFDDQPPVTVGFVPLDAELLFEHNDFSRPMAMKWLNARLAHAEIVNATPIVKEAEKVVPLVPSAVLGGGPLVAKGSLHVTPATALIRIEQVTLGAAEVKGAVKQEKNEWNGAVAGKFGPLPLGLSLKNGKLSAQAFSDDQWLPNELKKFSIDPELDKPDAKAQESKQPDSKQPDPKQPDSK